MARNARQPSAFHHSAAPFLNLVDDLDLRARDGERRVLSEAEHLLEMFETDLGRAGVAKPAIKPARYGLAVLLDQRARQTQGIALSKWSVLAQRQLFDGRDMSLPRIREFRDTAKNQGAGFVDLAVFLSDLIVRAEASRHAHRRTEGGGWGWKIAGFFVALVIALVGYAGFLEYRFHQRLSETFEAEALTIGLDRPQKGAELVRRLEAMATAVNRVSDAARRAPLKRKVRLPLYDSEYRALTVYSEAVQQHVPRAIADGIETVLATEGEGLVLYDALRAWSVLTGEADWSPGYLSGWLEDNGSRVSLAGLGAHVAPLNGPATDITVQDAELMKQARTFAAEVPEPARAWLELLRSDDMRALPSWRPADAVPGVARVLLRRSGVPVEAPLPGLFTQDGWTYARNYGVGIAVQKARDIAPLVVGQSLPLENRSPDLLMDRLHAETIAVWKEWLADLRVRPFAQRDTAIVVSGLLAQPENPLTDLLRAVWEQVGGRDRQRSHEQQLQLAREFGATIQYVEQGRMAEIARLFSALNVALGAIDINQRRGTDRLMSIQDKARSIAALKSAPRIVVQIAEDVLAQSAAPQASAAAGGNPLTRQWQQEIFPACRQTVQGRYPFADGADAAPGDVAALFGPQGRLSIFLRQSALPFLETDESPWRWKPEARFEGLDPETAEFFERAAQISEGLFGANGTLEHSLTLAALAERGQTMFAIGGAAQPVRATGSPASLSWPGPAPETGVEVSFRDSSDAGRILQPGPWGLLRLMDTLRLRLRDDGARVLLDLRSDSGRIFLEMAFEDTLNPVSVRSAMKGLECPPNL